MDNALKTAAEAFDSADSQRRADHRILARTVSQLKESYMAHTNRELTAL